MVCNNRPPSFPEGLDLEIFSFKALKAAQNNAASQFEREHVTPWLYSEGAGLNVFNLSYYQNKSHIRLTVDTVEDMQLARKLCEHFGEEYLFGTEEVIGYIEKNQSLLQINQQVSRSDLYR